ncbi:MAG: YhbY family RNA-binding protein [Nanoarchaeota archaeon]|nr:YhbY family RNA-binding protein [Nanoarchaeota archaeon]
MIDKELLKRSKILEPIIRIGKNGMNDNVVIELKKLLKIRKLIKVKILQSCPESKDDLIKKSLENTKAELVSKIGNTYVLWKK